MVIAETSLKACRLGSVATGQLPVQLVHVDSRPALPPTALAPALLR